jgi:hypothetical protein
MKWFVLVVALLHGFIHILGFVKGFDIKEIKELSLPISKPMGIVWLSAALLFIIYAVMLITNNRYTWLVGFIAVAVSQMLVSFYWLDAKFGTLPNVLILVVSIFLLSAFNFQCLVKHETAAIVRQIKPQSEKIISENAIENLPEPVQNWLRNSGAVGKPLINAGKVIQKAEMKMKPEQKNWMTANAIQLTTLDAPAFIWNVDVKMNSILNFIGRDKFENGKGKMLIKVNSLINVVNESGEKMDEGSLQRYLGEMVWFPSLALSPYVSWEAINDSSAKATMHYNGTMGSGIFHFNTAGDVIMFTALRFNGNRADSKRHEWIMKIEDYKVFEGIKVPAKMTATWKFDEGDWTWLKLEVVDIIYNELNLNN